MIMTVLLRILILMLCTTHYPIIVMSIGQFEAMRAGKHVLCEKPLAANTDEAIQMHQVAQEEERILMEAFRWRYHPLAKRLIELVENQSIGRITILSKHHFVYHFHFQVTSDTTHNLPVVL